MLQQLLQANEKGTGNFNVFALVRNTLDTKGMLFLWLKSSVLSAIFTAIKLVNIGVELVQGDLGDVDSLHRALEGAYGVIVVTTPGGKFNKAG